MDVYKYEKIRNVAILGHGGCGKTTLVEAMAYVTGVINRQGRVEDGNTISDYDKVAGTVTIVTHHTTFQIKIIFQQQRQLFIKTQYIQ